MTFYQKVKKALAAQPDPITYVQLADAHGWDRDATRLALIELLKRGKVTRTKTVNPEHSEWRIT